MLTLTTGILSVALFRLGTAPPDPRLEQMREQLLEARMRIKRLESENEVHQRTIQESLERQQQLTAQYQRFKSEGLRDELRQLTPAEVDVLLNQD